GVETVADRELAGRDVDREVRRLRGPDLVGPVSKDRGVHVGQHGPDGEVGAEHDASLPTLVVVPDARVVEGQARGGQAVLRRRRWGTGTPGLSPSRCRWGAPGRARGSWPRSRRPLRPPNPPSARAWP